MPRTKSEDITIKEATEKKPVGRPPKKAVFRLMIYAVGKEFQVDFESEQLRKVEVTRFQQRAPRGMPVKVGGYTFIGPVVLEEIDC